MQDKPTEAPLHWSRHHEQAAGYWQLKWLLFLFRLFPLLILRIIAFPVGFFYFLFSKKGRIESRRFLEKIAPLISDPKLAKKCSSRFGPLWHIISFSLAMIEKLQAWDGKFPYKDIHFHDDMVELIRELKSGTGVFLIFSHLGNTELMRGLFNSGQTGVSRNIPVVSIMDVNVTAHFRRMLKELNPQSAMDIVGVDEIGPETVFILEEKLASGGVVAITGDRTSSNGDGKNVKIPFLGKEAPFPSGVFYMAALMEAPVYCIIGLRRRDFSLKPEYDIHVHKGPLSFASSRKERFKRSSLLAASFVAYLESYSKEHPFQWYNFFDFWQEGA